MKVLVTGGAGYIGSTVASALTDEGITPVILDDLSTGRREFTEGKLFYEGDIADRDLLATIFAEQGTVDAVIHCAGSIVVPESVADPVMYYRNNVAKTVEFAHNLLSHGCERIIFSSSASVYAPAPGLVVDEDSAADPASPYAASKSMAERILIDTAAATPLRALILRYFNPVGADPQMRSGQYNPTPTHVLGSMLTGYRAGKPFTLFGTDWPTPDGTAIRDFIHIWDLAVAHVRAVQRFDAIIPGHNTSSQRHRVLNLGTGRGTSIRDLIAAFESVVGESIEVRVAGPRPGDVVGGWANSDRADRLLGKSERTVAAAIRDALAWDAKWNNVERS